MPLAEGNILSQIVSGDYLFRSTDDDVYLQIISDKNVDLGQSLSDHNNQQHSAENSSDWLQHTRDFDISSEILATDVSYLNKKNLGFRIYKIKNNVGSLMLSFLEIKTLIFVYVLIHSK